MSMACGGTWAGAREGVLGKAGDAGVSRDKMEITRPGGVSQRLCHRSLRTEG